MNTLAGLPAHPLLVHIPVVLIPLATIGVLLMVFSPSLRRRLGWAVVAVAGVGFLGAILAASTGEELLDARRSAGQTVTSTLSDHGEMGDGVQIFAGVFFVLLLGWVLFMWWQDRIGEDAAVAKVRKPKLIGWVLAVLMTVAGVGATVSVTITGHSGAKTVWEQQK
jgi:uncharacterized membrane protein